MNYLKGNQEEARIAQLQCLSLIEALFCEVNPIPVKEALNLLGYDYGVPRLPLIPLSTAGKEKLVKAMKDFGTIS